MFSKPLDQFDLGLDRDLEFLQGSRLGISGMSDLQECLECQEYQEC